MTRYWVWLDNLPLAQVELKYTQGALSGGQIIYLHPDHLNAPRIATSQQAIVWTWNSDAFGAALPNEDVDGNGVATHIPLRFPGQYYDTQTQLSYNYFRDYDANLGRYTENDPIGLRGGINSHIYVNANPVSLTDPLGLAPPPVVPEVIGLPAAQQNAVAASKLSNPLEFRELVKNKGAWDYKQYDPSYQAFGNYNFGVVAAASGFFDLNTILEQAGRAQCQAGTSMPVWGKPNGTPPYGDDPADQRWITEGWNDYKNGLYGLPRPPRFLGLIPFGASFYSNHIQAPLDYCSGASQCW